MLRSLTRTSARSSLQVTPVVAWSSRRWRGSSQGDEGSAPARWGLIADTHFKEQGLGAIEQATQWATDTFEQHGVNRVFVLGDMLNTREMVHVGAQSAAMSWVHSLVEKFGTAGEGKDHSQGGVHVLLGNHDMHLKHARGISSLDALSLPPMSSANLRLYKEPELIHCDGYPVLMLPYHHDQLELASIIKELCDRDPDTAARSVAMAHTAIHGAIQNTAWGTTFAGPLGISAFKGLARTFSGHFHAHQTLYQPGEQVLEPGTVETPEMSGGDSRGSLTYIGSPLQFNFGDLGDTNRGVIIYDPAADNFKLIPNPHGVRFTQVQLDDVLNAQNCSTALEALRKQVEGRMVSVAASTQAGWKKDAASLRQFEAAKEVLVGLGAKSVRKPFRRSAKQKELFVPTLSKAAKDRIRAREEEQTVAPYRFSDFVVPFVDQRIARADEGEKLSPDDREALLKEGLDIVGSAEKDKTGSVTTEREGVIFRGDIERLEMENFMGVKQVQTLDLGSFEDGVWYIQGRNGAGKSTVLEALTWCLFGQFLRSEMKADFAINDQVGKNTRVAVKFSNGYAIERFRKHSALGGTGFVVKKDGQPLEGMDKGNREAAQAGIDHLLGTNFAAYSKTVVLAEETARGFVQATPAARRQIIEDLLGFGEFELYLKELRVRLKGVKQAIAKLDTESNSLHTLAEAAEENAGRLQDRISGAGARIKACKHEIARLEKEIKPRSEPTDSEEMACVMEEIGRVAELQRTVDLATEWREQQNKWDSEERQLQMKKQQLSMRIATLRQQEAMLLEQQETVAHIAEGNQHLRDVKTALGRHQQQIPLVLEELGSELLAAAVPPVAKPTIPPMLNKAISSLAEGADEVEESLEELQEVLEEPFKNKMEVDKRSVVQLEVKLENCEKELGAVEGSIRQLEEKRSAERDAWEERHGDDDMEAAEELLSNGLPDRRQVQARLQAANAKRDELVAWQSPTPREDPRLAALKMELARADELQRGLDELIEQEKKKQKECIGRLSLLDGEKAQLVGREAVLSFWDEGFGRKGKSMRDYVFEENLFELNAVLEEVMQRLCDDGIDFHDLQTSLSKDFAFSGKDYGKRSSGERKRTALALFFSLVQLTRSRSRHQTEFIMLDECFDALDSSGQDSAHKIILEMHHGLGNAPGIRKAFVITHSQNANIGHLLRVEKTSAGTQFFPEPSSFA